MFHSYLIRFVATLDIGPPLFRRHRKLFRGLVVEFPAVPGVAIDNGHLKWIFPWIEWWFSTTMISYVKLPEGSWFLFGCKVFFQLYPWWKHEEWNEWSERNEWSVFLGVSAIRWWSGRSSGACSVEYPYVGHAFWGWPGVFDNPRNTCDLKPPWQYVYVISIAWQGLRQNVDI